MLQISRYFVRIFFQKNEKKKINSLNIHLIPVRLLLHAHVFNGFEFIFFFLPLISVVIFLKYIIQFDVNLAENNFHFHCGTRCFIVVFHQPREIYIIFTSFDQVNNGEKEEIYEYLIKFAS